MKFSSTQRRAVVAGLAGALVLLAGCADLPGGGTDETVELGDVGVENADDTAHTVHVLLERDSQPVYGTTVSVEAVSPPANESDFGTFDSRFLDNSAWAGDSGNWTVYTRVDTNTTWQAHSVPTGTDVECYSVRLTVEIDASVTGLTSDCDSYPLNTTT